MRKDGVSRDSGDKSLLPLELTFQARLSPRPWQTHCVSRRETAPPGVHVRASIASVRGFMVPRRWERYPVPSRQCRARFQRPLLDPRPAPPATPCLAARGHTHQHQELQCAHTVPLGLLELAEHATGAGEAVSPGPGRSRRWHPRGSRRSRGGRRDAGLQSCALCRVPTGAPPRAGQRGRLLPLRSPRRYGRLYMLGRGWGVGRVECASWNSGAGGARL